MAPPKFFRNFAEFEREMIRPGQAIGQNVEDILDDPSSFEKQYEFDKDPYNEEEEDE